MFVYKLLTEGTVEARIHELQLGKQALADGLFERTRADSPLWTEADLDYLFQPLDP